MPRAAASPWLTRSASNLARICTVWHAQRLDSSDARRAWRSQQGSVRSGPRGSVRCSPVDHCSARPTVERKSPAGSPLRCCGTAPPPRRSSCRGGVRSRHTRGRRGGCS
jgi:hypothetical protein